jgi:hypothetical protein
MKNIIARGFQHDFHVRQNTRGKPRPKMPHVENRI